MSLECSFTFLNFLKVIFIFNDFSKFYAEKSKSMQNTKKAGKNFHILIFSLGT